MTPFESARRLLAGALRDLDAAGTDGLEGLLRDALAEVTGQPFRIAKSGPQGGADVRSEWANTFRIGLESKRYGATTKLPLDALKAKLVEAAEGEHPLDLWILAATREISDTDERQLALYGEQLGITVLVLDWPRRKDALARLAVLCAAAPVTLAGFFPSAAMATALDEIRAHPLYEAQRASLVAQFLRPDCGYASAKAAMRNWLREGFDSPGQARKRLDGFNDLNAPQTKRIDRPAPHQALDAWWDQPGAVAALLGAEGHGKTWAALAWWERQDQLDSSALPLTVFISARLIRSPDPLEAIALVLADRTGLRTAPFWRRRLEHWRDRPAQRPRLLLVLDGLDQKWRDTNWADFLQPLLGDESAWAAVILTSRPDRWQALHGLSALEPRPLEIPTPAYDDGELDALLDLHGLHRDNFAPAVLPLLRVPRVALEAIRMQAELAQSGDITPERLAFEDWRSSIRRNGERLKIDNEEFHQLVRDRGLELRASAEDGTTVSRAEIIQKLTAYSGYGAEDLDETISEIVSGAWFEPGEHRHQFRLKRSLTPFALALVLTGELRGVKDEAEAEGLIALAMDPLRAQDLGVAVLRAATTIAFLDPKAPTAARTALLQRWLSEQNFRNTDFDAFWRLIGDDTAVAFNVLERASNRDQGGLFEDEILMKGFANAYQFPQVARVLEEHALRWLGGVWVPTRAKRREDFDAAIADQRLADRLAQWRTVQERVGGPALHTTSAETAEWLVRRALGIISFLPRAPFVRALTTLALARAVMEETTHFDEVAWLVRLNAEDGPEAVAALTGAAEDLARQPDEISRRAAAWLFEALGVPTLEDRAQSIWDDLEARGGERAYPCRPRTWPYRDPALEPGSRSEDIDPYEVDTILASGERLWLHGVEPGDSDTLLAMDGVRLVRLRPGGLAAMYRAAMASAPARDADGLLGLMFATPETITLLGPSERAAARALFEAGPALPAGTSTKAMDPLKKRRAKTILMFDLLFATPEEQVERLAKANRVAGVQLDARHWLLAPRSAKLDKVVEPLAAASAAQAASWLKIITWLAVPDDLKTWPGLADLVVSPDAAIRTAALEVAFLVDHEAALAAHAGSGWRADPARSAEENQDGSRALVAAHHLVAPVTDLLARVDRAVLAQHLEAAPADPAALDAYARFVEDDLEEARTATSRPWPRHWRRQDDAIEILVAARPDWAVGLVTPFLTASARLPMLVIEDFPMTDICRSLLRHRPEVGVELWRRLDKAQQTGGLMRSRALSLLPMRAPDHPAIRAAWREIIEAAISDSELFEIARAGQDAGQEDALYEVITPDLTSVSVADRARAMTLLAFADASPIARALWDRLEQDPPGGRWLTSVHDHARVHYERNQHARHWLQAYLTAPSEDLAIDAYFLLREVIDGRGRAWCEEFFTTYRDQLPRLRHQHWSLNVEGLNRRIKERATLLKSNLFFTATLSRAQAPWT